MPLLVNSVPNLAQGVSQQPDSLRYPGQCDEQVNAWATVVEGLVKRPNTNFVSKVSTSNGAGLFTHFVKRDEDNKYCVTVSLGGVGVIDLDSGNNISVATTSIAQSYLSGITNPLADLRALTVADYTFLVNKKKTVSKDPDLYSNPPEEEALIVVKLGDYAKGYSVYIDDVLVTIDTGSNLENTHHDPNHVNTHSYGLSYISGPSSGPQHADTEFIANHLTEIIAENRGSSSSGIGEINLTDGGSGWLQNIYGRIKDIDRNIFGIKAIEYHKVGVTTQPTKLEFQVIQEDTVSGFKTVIGGTTYTSSYNTTAKGFCNVQNGEIQDFVFTNKGTGYKADTTTYPLTIRLTEKVYMDGKWQTAGRDVDPEQPTYQLPSIVILPALIVERSGSVIKLKKSITVSNGGNYYILREPHESSSLNEPGSGTDWQTYWYETTQSAGATVWASGTSYFTAQDIKVHTSDGLADEGLQVVHKEVQSITDLPKQCYNNFSVKVIGDADIDQDDYYVRFRTKDKDDFGEGTWVERSGWQLDETESNLSVGIQLNYDPETMPITLVPVFTGSDITSFKLQSPEEDLFGTIEAPREVGWRSRQAGDDETNPFPSFVGKTINDVFFFKNRLGFLTDSNVIFSEADEYFNFFRTTTQQLLDSAPIDVGLSHTKVARLQYAKAFQEKLMLFSDSSQFALRGADVLSPKTVAISPVSEYDTTDNVEPLVLGNYIYFPFNRDQYVGMYEYYVDSNTEVFEAQEITEHVSKYIPSSVRMMAGSTTQNTVVIQSDTTKRGSLAGSYLYIYKYFWSGKEKIQSAWQSFQFPYSDDILGFDFIDSTLYLFMQRGANIILEKLILEEGIVDDTNLLWKSDYSLLLDSAVLDITSNPITGYDPLTNKTTITDIPYVDSNMELWSKYGCKKDFTIINDSTIELEGPIYDTVDYGGDSVKYDGKFYYCIEAHTSSSTFESQYWTEVEQPVTGSFQNNKWVGQYTDWAASTAYNKGTKYGCLYYSHESSFSTYTNQVDLGDEYKPGETILTWVPFGAEVRASAVPWSPDRWYEGGVDQLVLGYPYSMLYKFSDQTLKQPTEKGGRSASNYTYQTLRTGSLNYADTGFFQVEVTPKHRDSYYYPFNSNLLGEGSLVNKFTPQDGHFRFPIQAQPGQVDIKITSNSALPVKLLGAEFESMIIPRTRRYGA